MIEDGLEFQPPGFPYDNSEGALQAEWLRDFPYERRTEIQSWLNEDKEGVWIVPPIPSLAELRASPYPALELIFNTLEYLWKVLPPPGRIVWALDNDGNRGLDDFEAEAIFGKWLVIRDLIQINQGKEKSKIIVTGSFRQERIGLSFLWSDLGLLKMGNLRKSLSIIEKAKVAGVSIFLSSPVAKSLNGNPAYLFLKKKIRSLLDRQSISLALWIPKERTQKGLSDLEGEIQPLRKLGRLSSEVRLLRFEDVDRLNPPMALQQAMEKSSIECNCSMISKGFDGPSPEVNQVLRGPYFQAGAYQSQCFDIRVPAGSISFTRKIELIGISLRGAGQNLHLKQLWENRLGASIEKYRQLLDFRRMEKYFQSFEQSLELKQTYHHYRIYNWPEGDPSPRVTFFDGGNLLDPGSISDVMKQFEKMQDASGKRWKVVGQAELVEASWEEARQRVTGKNQQPLAHQREAHQYLKTLPMDGPLREDVKDFVEFLPSALGRTLEIGSGIGQLARFLCSRSIQYICVDLHAEIFLNRYDQNPMYGVTADIHHLPIRESSFQSVIANNILEHSSDPLTCLQEIWRALKPGGKIYTLIPLDGLNVRHQIRTHYWKTDMQGITNAFQLADFAIRRQETINLYELGVAGCFPSCHGLVAKIEAEKLERAH